MYSEATDGAKDVSLHLFRSFANGALRRIDSESPAFYMISQVTYLKQYHICTIFRFCESMYVLIVHNIYNSQGENCISYRYQKIHRYIVYFELRKVIKVHMFSESHKSLKKNPILFDGTYFVSSKVGRFIQVFCYLVRISELYVPVFFQEYKNWCTYVVHIANLHLQYKKIFQQL